MSKQPAAVPPRPWRIVFMGTPDFAVPALERLLAGPDQVVAVVCQPDRPRGRGRRVQAPPVKLRALEAGLPVLQPTAIRGQDFTEELAALRPDLLVVAAYGRILPGPVLRLPPMGAINIHGSLLPRFRGAAPIQWAVIRGESETGVSIMYMDEGMDTGDVLLQASLPISDQDTSGALFPRVAELGARTLMQALDGLEQGTVTPRPQDHSLATEAPPLSRDLGRLDWNRPAWDLHCLIRGLDPWPLAVSELAGRRLALFAPALEEDAAQEGAAQKDAAPGTVLRADARGLLVATADAPLLIREVRPEGRARMAAGDFINGARIQPGACFTPIS